MFIDEMMMAGADCGHLLHATGKLWEVFANVYVLYGCFDGVVIRAGNERFLGAAFLLGIKGVNL